MTWRSVLCRARVRKRRLFAGERCKGRVVDARKTRPWRGLRRGERFEVSDKVSGSDTANRTVARFVAHGFRWQVVLGELRNIAKVIVFHWFVLGQALFGREVCRAAFQKIIHPILCTGAHRHRGGMRGLIIAHRCFVSMVQTIFLRNLFSTDTG